MKSLPDTMLTKLSLNQQHVAYTTKPPLSLSLYKCKNFLRSVMNKQRSVSRRSETRGLPSVSRQIRHWVCSPCPASRSISEGSTIGDGGTNGDNSSSSAIWISNPHQHPERAPIRFRSRLFVLVAVKQQVIVRWWVGTGSTPAVKVQYWHFYPFRPHYTILESLEKVYFDFFKYYYLFIFLNKKININQLRVATYRRDP